jgi:predicted exporter
LILAVAAVMVLFFRLQISFDISAFFPRETGLEHEVLLEQFRNGPGSRVLVVGLHGASHEQLVELSDSMRSALAGDKLFSSVSNGEYPEDVTTPPEPVASYLLLMRDIDYSRQALQTAVNARLQDLAFGGGSAMLGLFGRDPYLKTLDVLEQLVPASMTGEMWFARDGSAVLMAETRATAVDISAQEHAIARIRQVFESATDDSELNLDITGPGAFGVELQQIIRAEAKFRSVLASIALLVVVFLFFRKPRYLLLASLPIAMGFVVGLAVLSVLFESIHGITLAFGFTLMGVAIDYPMHLFSHAGRDGGLAAIDRIWPTLRLGAVSTAIAYIALAFSGSDGLAQLGTFTAVGVLVAVAVTRYWLPGMLVDQAVTGSGGSPSPARLAYFPAIAVLVAALVGVSVVASDGVWDDRLTSLSPVPGERLSRDQQLRSSVGPTNMRYQLVIHARTLEELLLKSERLDLNLQAATDEGLLRSWQSLTQIIASSQTQQRRRDAIPKDSDLRMRLADILRDSPFRADAFDAFADLARTSSTLPLLTHDDVRATPLRSWLESHLLNIDDHWIAVVTLTDPSPDALAARVIDWGDEVLWLDMHSSSQQLLKDYRLGALATMAFAALIIAALMWYQRRNILQVVWIALSVTAVVSATVLIIVLLHGQLTVIHLVALLLVTGLGLDYALFFSRPETLVERRATNQAVTACAVSTVVAFGLLAGSSIPVLKFLGLTVAAGSALSYIVAIAGSRPRHGRI